MSDKRVKVEIPFHLSATKTDHIKGDIITVSEETLAKIRAVNINMVSVIGDAIPEAEAEGEMNAAPKPKAKKKQVQAKK